MRSYFCLRAVIVSVVVLLLVGCEKTEPIVTYTVPKHESIQVAVEKPDKKTSPARMLAAMILDRGNSWSFKGLGSPNDFPDDAAERFRELIQSLKFEDPAKPSWDLGEQWTELPASGMRSANLKLGEIVFSVIKLPVNTPNTQRYLLDNLNRWQGQLGLPDIGLDEIDSKAQKVATSDGHEAFVLDIKGEKDDDASMPPMMRGAAPRRPLVQPQKPRTPKFTGKPPEEWKESQPRPMQLANYVVGDDDKTAVVSVSMAGGPVFGNVNRWRGQVGLSPLASEDELETESVTVSGQSGLLVEIDGEESSILIALVPEDAPKWFFKMQGPTDVVQSQATSFREYLDTIKIEP